MNRARRLAFTVAALGAVACHRASPGDAPIPAPTGEPPQVQPPIESAPIGDPPAAAASPAADPQLRRFEVVAVDDTTFTILVGAERWVRRGTTGIAVDPRRRDALIARFRVISRAGDSVTALVTGQTAPIQPTHVALIRQPVPGPLRQDAFWAGLFLGLGAGAAAVLLFRH